jgi:hypothetical protein
MFKGFRELLCLLCFALQGERVPGDNRERELQATRFFQFPCAENQRLFTTPPAWVPLHWFARPSARPLCDSKLIEMYKHTGKRPHPKSQRSARAARIAK